MEKEKATEELGTK